MRRDGRGDDKVLPACLFVVWIRLVINVLEFRSMCFCLIRGLLDSPAGAAFLNQ
jgi:hypothetical protein